MIEALDQDDQLLVPYVVQDLVDDGLLEVDGKSLVLTVEGRAAAK